MNVRKVRGRRGQDHHEIRLCLLPQQSLLACLAATLVPLFSCFVLPAAVAEDEDHRAS